jgi:hypothetical protein
VRAGGGADNGGEKRNILVVSVLLPIIIDLALRSKTQRRIEVLRKREQPVLLRVATAPKAFIRFMCDTLVEDQAPAAILVSQVILNIHVAAPLVRTCRDSGSSKSCNNLADACVPAGCGPCVQRAEESSEHRDHPVSCVVSTYPSQSCAEERKRFKKTVEKWYPSKFSWYQIPPQVCSPATCDVCC